MKFLTAFLTCLLIAGCADTVTAPKPSITTTTKGDPDRWWQPQSDTNKWWSPSSRKIKHASVVVASITSENGVVVFSDSLFADHPDDPVVLINTFGSVGYGPPCFRVENTDGTNLANGPDSDPIGGGSAYTLVCALLSVYVPQTSNNLTVHSDSGFDYRVEIVYNPDYALSYMSLPRYEVTFLPL